MLRDDFLPGDSDFSLSGNEAEDALLAVSDGEAEHDPELEVVPPGGVAPELASGPASSSADLTTKPAGKKSKRPHTCTDEVKSAGCRELTRLKSDPVPDQPEAQNMLCIVGRPLKYPVAVHPVKVDGDGKRWICVNEHQYWLRRSIGTLSAGTTHYEVHFQAAVTWVRTEFQNLIAEARKQMRADGQQEAIRKGLGISDSETEQDPRQRSKKQRLAKNVIHKTEFQVTFMGTPVCVRNQVRPVCVECSLPVVCAIIKACKDKAQEHFNAPTPSQASLARQQRRAKRESMSAPAAEEVTAPPPRSAKASDRNTFSMANLSAGIPSKVTWQPSVPGWAVHYKEGGKTAIKRVPIKMPRGRSMLNTQNPPVNMSVLREQAFLEACQQWNELDTSKRPRIELEDLGSSL